MAEVMVRDGTWTFDGEWIRLEWNWTAEEGKKSAGPQRFALKDLIGLEWIPNAGLENGHLRFRLRDSEHKLAPKHNPHCLVLWGMDKETRTTALLVTAILVRLPHPSGAFSGPARVLSGARIPAPDREEGLSGVQCRRCLQRHWVSMTALSARVTGRLYFRAT
jgi:hypothetical protein